MAYYSYYIIYLIRIIRKAAFLITFLLFFTFAFGQNHADIQLANEYLLKGDKKKSVELYRDLSKNDANVPLIHNNYVSLMLDLGAYDEALTYLKKISKRDPQNIQYKLDVGLVYVRSGDLSKADRYLREIIGEVRSNVQLSKTMSDYLAARSLTDYSI